MFIEVYFKLKNSEPTNLKSLKQTNEQTKIIFRDITV